MSGNQTNLSPWLLVFASLGVLSACSEKKVSNSTPTTKIVKQNGSGSGSEGSGSGSGSGSSDSDGSFGLCDDGLKEADLDDFKSYVRQLCDDGKLKELRKEENLYTGDESKIIEDDVEKSETELSLRLYTSTIASAAVDDYWALMQLQLKDSKAYKENFEFDSSAELSNQDVDDDKVSYNYKNDSGKGGVVDYDATTEFVTLKKGQAYLSATILDKSNDGMTKLKGLIIINKKSSSKTEVFTMSDQTYSHDDQADALESEAIDSAENEQERMFKNAKKADEAPDLLGDK